MTNLIDNLGGLIGFGENHLRRGDSNYAAGIDLRTIFGPDGLKFLGLPYTYLAVNVTGSLSMSNDASLGVAAGYPPELSNTGQVVLAPFFSRVNTYLSGGAAAPNQVTPTAGGTSRGSDLVWFDLDASGNGAVTATWDDVGTNGPLPSPRNAFQVQVVGQGSGNFDFVFRYETIEWGTKDGKGLSAASVGFYDGATGWQDLQAQGLDPAAVPGNTGVAGFLSFSVRSGTDGSERVDGTAGQDFLGGGAGRDRVHGFGGNDVLAGNAGVDTLYGGVGDDLYVWDGRDKIVEPDAAGQDTVCSRVSMTLPENVECLVLTGDADVDGLGNALDNVLSGNLGNNVLDGAAGRDTVDYSAGGGVVVDLRITSAQTVRTGDQDTLVSIENLIGSAWKDSLTGDDGANVLDGGKHNDTLSGGAGDDTLIGGAGTDVFRGGNGNDVFVFVPGEGGGRVLDFSTGSDRIDLSSFDLNPSLEGRQGFTFIGTDDFEYGRALGKARFEGGALWLSTDADWNPEIIIQLRNVTSLSEADFIF